MNGRQSPEDKAGLGRGALVAYLITGAALAVSRVSLLAWVEHRSVSGRMTAGVYSLIWGLVPRGTLG